MDHQHVLHRFLLLGRFACRRTGSDEIDSSAPRSRNLPATTWRYVRWREPLGVRARGMIDRIERLARRGRRVFDRSRWAAKLLGLPSAGTAARPGLLILQIDGLSHGRPDGALVA